MAAKAPRPPLPAQSQTRPGLEARMRPRPSYKGEDYRAAGKLRGKRALVTGGDSGIGRAVAVLFAREGADVAIVYLPVEEPDARETARAVRREGRRCLLLPGDVSDSSFCRGAVERAAAGLGGLDILVNNAARQKGHAAIEEISDSDWERTFKVNIHGYFYMARAALAHMKEGACIVNCGSVVGRRGSGHLIDYGATKGAIETFTKSLAASLIPRVIRVNCVAPGPVWTPLNVADRKPESVARFGSQAPMGRPAQPDEIAPAFVFLASNADSSYITGEVLSLTGGET